MHRNRIGEWGATCEMWMKGKEHTVKSMKVVNHRGRGGEERREREADKVRTDSVVNCIALCILQYNYSPSKNT